MTGERLFVRRKPRHIACYCSSKKDNKNDSNNEDTVMLVLFKENCSRKSGGGPGKNVFNFGCTKHMCIVKKTFRHLQTQRDLLMPGLMVALNHLGMGLLGCVPL